MLLYQLKELKRGRGRPKKNNIQLCLGKGEGQRKTKARQKCKYFFGELLWVSFLGVSNLVQWFLAGVALLFLFSSTCLVPSLSLGCRGGFGVWCFWPCCFVVAIVLLVGLVGWLALWCWLLLLLVLVLWFVVQFVCNCCLVALICWIVKGAWCLVLGATWLLVVSFAVLCSWFFCSFFLVSRLVVALLCLSCFHSLLLFFCSSL